MPSTPADCVNRPWLKCVPCRVDSGLSDMWWCWWWVRWHLIGRTVERSGRALISDIINAFARRVCGNPQKHQSGNLVCGQRPQLGYSLVKLGGGGSSRERSRNSALNINIAHSVDTSTTHLPTVTPVSCQSHRHCGRKHQFLIQFPTASRCAPHFLSWCSCWIGALIARRCSVGIGWWVSASRLLLSVSGWPQVPATDRQTQQVQLQADAISHQPVAQLRTVTAVHICVCVCVLCVCVCCVCVCVCGVCVYVCGVCLVCACVYVCGVCVCVCVHMCVVCVCDVCMCVRCVCVCVCVCGVWCVCVCVCVCGVCVWCVCVWCVCVCGVCMCVCVCGVCVCVCVCMCVCMCVHVCGVCTCVCVCVVCVCVCVCVCGVCVWVLACS